MRGESHDRQLAPGTTFESARGSRRGVVRQLLGMGGQGAVYEVEIDGRRFALKWYHDHYIAIDRGLRQRLTQAVERGAPDRTFLWPLDIVVRPDSESFGYIMLLRDPAYAGMRGLIARPPDRIELTLALRMMLCARVANSFLELHSRGFCYQDINFGNLFLDPTTADILICDNDNVNIDGAEASIYGTRKFMAPEVVRREVLPSTTTDLFSMAVLFFYALIGWHPLDGRREASFRVLDGAAELSLYGTAPVFLFDPDDDSNGPVPGLHDPLVMRWSTLSRALRQLFVRSFSEGLNQPSRRVLEFEWRNAFVAAHASIFTCTACGYEHCADPELASQDEPSRCARCGEVLIVPPLMTVGRTLFAAQPGRAMPRHCLGAMTELDFTQTVASAESHPSDPRIVGLRNRGQDEWQARIPGRGTTRVPPDRAVRLTPGTEIVFGKATGRVLGAPAA